MKDFKKALGFFWETGLGLGFMLLVVSLTLSCQMDSPSEPEPVPVLDTRTFWAEGFSPSGFYEVQADLLVDGAYCKVWVEHSAGIGLSTARNMADAYDTLIYPRMLKTFGLDMEITEEEGGPVVASNTMELSDWLADGDGKLTILLLDIKDEYKPSENESYVGGYFWMGNFYQKDPAHPYLKYSNETDMIYVDSYPGVPGSEASNRTVAHEMQHLMNFVTTVLLALLDFRTNVMDTWIDEGLSSAAEYVCMESHPEERYKWFNADPSGLISRGNNFFVWGNHGDNQYALLDDYSTVYLFFQWLRLQAEQEKGGKDFLRNVSLYRYYDYRAVVAAAYNIMPGKGYTTWESVLKPWMAANYLNAPTGKYGYLNDPVLKTIRAKTAPKGITSLPLAPGEGVYSMTSAAGTLPSSRGNIKYAGLFGNSAPSDTATFKDGALLTYNVNTNLAASSENGQTTGEGVDPLPEEARHAGGLITGPIRIDPRDMSARKGGGGTNGLMEGSLLKNGKLIGVWNAP
jgi:hypothetical protein